jgi:hypothetical protein
VLRRIFFVFHPPAAMSGDAAGRTGGVGERHADRSQYADGGDQNCGGADHARATHGGVVDVVVVVVSVSVIVVDEPTICVRVVVKVPVTPATVDVVVTVAAGTVAVLVAPGIVVVVVVVDPGTVVVPPAMLSTPV